MHEYNVIRKPWREDHLRIALVYPNVYSAMAGLTIQTLYHIWNKFPEVICERFFMPSKELNIVRSSYKHKNIKYSINSNKKIRQYQTYPKQRSLENQMPLTSFDIIAFTVSYELDFPNILWILNNGNIPLFRKDRDNYRDNYRDNLESNKDFPLILAGGPVIRSNPLPIEQFIDCAFIGEIEPVNDLMINSWFKSRNLETTYTYSDIQIHFLQSLQNIPGFWVPKLYDSKVHKEIERVYVKNLDNYPHPLEQIIPKFNNSEINPLPFGESVYIEVNRGCPHFCRFCMTGSQLKPFRNRSLSNLKEIIKSALKKSDVSKVVLIGSSVTDHPKFEELCKFLVDLQVEFSIPSIRIDTLTKKFAMYLAKSGMKTVAIAPETGTNELRQKLNKNITNTQIINGAKLLFQAGIPNIKLYILYGLPFETEEDIDSIPKLAKNIAALGYGKNGVKLSINPFIPKAHTPFEGYIDNFEDANLLTLKKKLNRIISPLKGDKQIKYDFLSPEEAYIQTFLALGDKNMSKLILEYFNCGRGLKKWYQLTKKQHLNNSELFTRFFQGIKGASFGSHSWNFISQKLSITILENEWKKAQK